MRIHKKAQFIPFLVVFSIIIFSALAYVMYKHNNYQESIKLNTEASTLFKIYGLAERNKYYLQQSAELSKQKATNELEQNAGHLQGQCSTDLTSGKIIWNSCQKLNLNEDFKKLFEKEFKEYIKAQDQPYPKEDFEASLNDKEVKDLIPIINIKDKKLLVDFNDFSYNLNFISQSKEFNSFNIKYIFNPSFSISSPDFSVYTQICDVLTDCNLNSRISQNQIDSCINSLNQINNLKLSQNNQILELSYKDTGFLVNLNSEIDCQPSLISATV